MSRTARTIIIYLAIVVLVMMAVNAFVSSATEPTQLTLPEFQTALADHHVASVTDRIRLITPAPPLFGGRSDCAPDQSRE